MTHYQEYNQIEIPPFLRHWQDRSYHNDLCARSEYEVGEGLMRIWVDHDDPAEREDVNLPKYVVFFYPREEDEHNGDIQPVYEGNDAATAEAWAKGAEILQCGPDDDDAPGAIAKAEAIRRILTGEK